jgi:Ca2+-binding RTX toxin-like protein
MFRRTARFTTAAAGLAAGGLLVTAPAPAQADPDIIEVPPPVCSIFYTNVVTGTAGDDVLRGTGANDLILGLGGDDVIYGAGGRDIIRGGDGDDVLIGGPADDCVRGGSGADESVQYLYTEPNGNDDSHSVLFRYEY